MKTYHQVHFAEYVPQANKRNVISNTYDGFIIAVYMTEPLTPFRFDPKMHFLSWLRRHTGRLEIAVDPKDVELVRDQNPKSYQDIERIICKFAEESPRWGDNYHRIPTFHIKIFGKSAIQLTDQEVERLLSFFEQVFVPGPTQNNWELYYKLVDAAGLVNTTCLEVAE